MLAPPPREPGGPLHEEVAVTARGAGHGAPCAVPALSPRTPHTPLGILHSATFFRLPIRSPTLRSAGMTMFASVFRGVVMAPCKVRASGSQSFSGV